MNFRMWLFTGRYAQYGPVICLIAFATLAVGLIFFVSAVRLARRSDLVAAIVTAAFAAFFGYSSSYGEPVFVGNGTLNRGAALFLAVIGLVLGVCGKIFARRLRLTRLLLLLAAAGILFGDVAGWIHRSTGPSKFDQPIGRLWPRVGSADAKGCEPKKSCGLASLSGNAVLSSALRKYRSPELNQPPGRHAIKCQ